VNNNPSFELPSKVAVVTSFENVLVDVDKFKTFIAVKAEAAVKTGDADELEQVESLTELNNVIDVQVKKTIDILQNVDGFKVSYEEFKSILLALSTIDLSCRTLKVSLSKQQGAEKLTEQVDVIYSHIVGINDLIKDTLYDVRSWNIEYGEYRRTSYVPVKYVPKKKASVKKTPVNV